VEEVAEMKIPLVERLPPDVRIPLGPRKGERRYYKTALLNTLIHLRPRACLEIGTWRGGSAKIFRRYFEQYRPDGFLITADIKQYVTIKDKRVYQTRVYPHTLKILQLHKSVKEADLLPDWRDKVDVSVKANIAILRIALNAFRAKRFDFAFVDGDHWNLLKDVDIVSRVTKRPRYMLLDDTTAHVWDCSQVYFDEIKPNWGTYDFDGWDIFTGTSLIWDTT